MESHRKVEKSDSQSIIFPAQDVGLCSCLQGPKHKLHSSCTDTWRSNPDAQMKLCGVCVCRMSRLWWHSGVESCLVGLSKWGTGIEVGSAPWPRSCVSWVCSPNPAMLHRGVFQGFPWGTLARNFSFWRLEKEIKPTVPDKWEEASNNSLQS